MKSMMNEARSMRNAVMAIIIMIMIAAGMSAATDKTFAADDKTPLGANQVELNEDVTGETYSHYYDHKYYKFTTRNDKGIEYSIKLINTGDNLIAAYLCNEDLETVYPVGGTYYRGSDFGPEVGKWYTPIFDLGRNQTYYIEIYSSGGKSTFSFCVNAKVTKPAKVFLNKVSTKRKSVKVTWHKSNLANSYEVAVKKQGGSWRTYISSKTSKTIEGLTSGKKYTVRVRAIRVYNDKQYKGKWSDKFTVKVK